MYAFDVRDGMGTREKEAAHAPVGRDDDAWRSPTRTRRPSELRLMVEVATRMRFSMPRPTEAGRMRRGRPGPIVHG